MSLTSVRLVLASLIVALLAGVVFTPGLPGEFVFDDIPNITTNPAVHLKELNREELATVLVTPQLSGTTRLLPTLSFALDYYRGDGPDPMVFKTTNIVVHGLTACALAWFFHSLMLISGVSRQRAQWLGPALALAWAIHPLQVSSVLYVVQRIQTMGTLFLVLALWTYLQARHSQIHGRPGRTRMLVTILLWAAAMGCKEDSALFPAYTLALELTVLRFAAADPRLTSRLKRGYLAATLVAAAVYFLVVLPHFWHWEAYPGRNYSTLERLLTQPRVLCMYLWQILIPFPGNMPFYYDWVQPSRSLLQPWTTLPAVGVLLALLGVAWRLRGQRPLLSLGILLFFAAHLIASNVPNLELAFEHRNHFGLAGAVLAIGSLLGDTSLRLRPIVQAGLCSVVLAALAGATLTRSQIWNSTLSIARHATQHAPGSGRAWTQLCASHFSAGGGAVPDNPLLNDAIAICETGADKVPGSANALTLLVALKSLRGDVTSEDWERLQHRLSTVYMTRDNARVYLVLTYHARLGIALDRTQLVETLDILKRRGTLGSYGLASIGYFIMNDLSDPELAIPYFSEAIIQSHPDDPFGLQLAAELRARNKNGLASDVEDLVRSQRHRANTSGQQEQ